MKEKGITKFILQLLVSGGLVLLLLLIIDVKEMFSLIRNINFIFFVCIIGLFSVDRMLMAYKWNLLLKVKGMNIPLKEVVKVYYMGTFMGLFLPTTVGIDVIRGYKLFRDGYQGSDVVSSIIIERFLGFIASAILALISSTLLLFVLDFDIAHIFYLSFGLFVGLILIFILSMKIHIFAKLDRVKSVFIQKLNKLYNSYRMYQSHKKILVIFLLLSLIEQLVPVFANYLASCALNLSIPLWIFFLVMPIVQLIARMPIPSFNSLGVIEGLMAYLFSILHLSTTHAVTIGLIGQIAILLATLPGIYFIFTTKTKVSRV